MLDLFLICVHACLRQGRLAVQSRRRAINKEQFKLSSCSLLLPYEIPKVKNYSPQRSSRLGTNTYYCSDTVHAIGSRSSLLMMTTIFLLWSKERGKKRQIKSFLEDFCIERKKTAPEKNSVVLRMPDFLPAWCLEWLALVFLSLTGSGGDGIAQR